MTLHRLRPHFPERRRCITQRLSASGRCKGRNDPRRPRQWAAPRCVRELGRPISAELDRSLRERPLHPVAGNRERRRRASAATAPAATSTGAKCSQVGKAVWAAGARRRKSNRASTSKRDNASAAQASNSLAHAGMSDRNAYLMLWVRKPLPNTSTPPSRSGPSACPSANNSWGSRRGMEIWSTGTSAPGYIATRGTYAPWSSPRSGPSVNAMSRRRSSSRTRVASSGAPGAGYSVR